MFILKGPVARNSPTHLEDSANIKMALTSLGYYDDTETGLSPYGDRQLFQSIKSFQKDNALKVDGIINPDGPTQKSIKEKLAENKGSGNAFIDFKKNFDLMNEANTKDADKYFHCVANYEATQRGWGGEMTAGILSDAKELKDKYWERYEDGEEDQKANRHGRKTAKSGQYSSAREACAIFRPAGLDEKY